MTNSEIARRLQETAALVELTGGSRYRAAAFRRAARRISDLDTPVTDRVGAGTLTQLDGIGKGLEAQIEELAGRGSFALRDELLETVPPGLLEVLRVKGLGTKKVRRLWNELGITSLDNLEAEAAAGRLVDLDGFGAKTQANVLENVRLLKTYRTRRRYPDAWTAVHPVLEALRKAEGVTRVEPAGALRRRLETVARDELIVVASHPRAVEQALSDGFSDRTGRPEHDDLVFEGTLPDGFPLHVRLVPKERFGTAWWLMTGSDEHCTAFREAYGAPAPHPDESDVYAEAGLPFIEPELREGRGELEAAAEGALPDLITEEDLHGTLHNHSTYSDGKHSLRQMAEAARQMGYTYFGICDHSQSLSIAGGLSPEHVAAQQEEIQVLNEEFSSDGASPFRILSGIESDIRTDGSLDYADDVLASLDLVVASVHQGLTMQEDQATERLLRAIENPHTTILGHPTGRLLLKREGYPLDIERVIDACATHDVAIELNANPQRLDLDWRHLRRAADAGVLIAINPDAHATGELNNMCWGVAAARKAWLSADECLNAKSLSDFERWLHDRQPAAR